MPEINVSEEKKIQVSERTWNKLQEDLRFLRCLEAAGVDNWEWYDEAVTSWRAGENG